MIVETIFLIQIIITVLFSIMAAFYDIKSNIVPNKLNYSLIFFGLFSNLILSIISNNVKYILASFISMLITYIVTYMLWKLNVWGGGDVKLFTAIATVIPSGLNINFLNIFPQLSVYPFSFSVVINSILVSFPFLVVFVAYLIFKNKIFDDNIDFLVNVFNIGSIKYIKNSTLNRLIPIKDLKEGMIVNDYYFNNEYIIEFDGQQHFQSTAGWNSRENVINNHKKDLIKNQYCFKNNIPLIRICYKEQDNIQATDLLLDSKFLITKENEQQYYDKYYKEK